MMTMTTTGCRSLTRVESARRWPPLLLTARTAAALRLVYLIRSRDHRPKAVCLPVLHHEWAHRPHPSPSPSPSRKQSQNTHNPSPAVSQTLRNRPISGGLQVPNGAPLATSTRMPETKENAKGRSREGPVQFSE